MNAGERLFSEQPPEIEVFMAKWAMLQGEGALRTIEIGPCIAVSVYDPVLHLALLGHFLPQATGYQESFNQFLNTAKSEVKDLPLARIWIGGGSIGFADKLDSITLESRKSVASRVRQELVVEGTTTRKKWLDEPGSIDYKIDARTGEETIRIQYHKNIEAQTGDEI